MKFPKIKSKKNKKHCLILFNWLILSTILISLCVTGCIPTGQTNTKKQFQLSNGSRAKYKKEKEQNRQENINYEETAENGILNDILEYEKNINNDSGAKTKRKNKTEKSTDADKYETLRKQQEIMSDEFNESIYNVKEELLELKRILSDIASDKLVTTAGRNNNNYSDNLKENSLNNQESTKIMNEKDDLLDKTFLIQSEEAHNPKENTKPNTSNNNPKQNKNFKIIKQGTEKPNQNNQKETPQNVVVTSVKKTTDNDFSEVISKVAKNDYIAASKIINDKLKQSKDPVVISNCNYWLGEINFNQRDYNKSITYFKTALNNNCDKKDIAQARIAESYFRIGKNSEAKIAYQNLLNEYPKSTYSPKAKKMLQQL